MSPQSRNIHLVDDDEVVRDALGALFRSRGLSLHAYPDAAAFLHAWRERHLAGAPACLLLDVRMPGMSGMELFDRLKSAGLAPHHAVIFLTGHGDIPMAVEALRSGAYYFFEKPHSGNQLVDRVLESLEHVCQIAQAGAPDSAAALELLSPRERAIAHRIAEGHTNRQIADDLCISVRTVEVHRARIFSKLEVKSAVGLVQRLAHGKAGPHPMPS